MKYLALLGDSFREALDSKVLYFTLGLTALLLFLLGSIHFKFLTVADQAQGLANRLNFIFRMQAQGPLQKEPAKVEVVHYKQLDSSAEPWHSGHELTMQLNFPQSLGQDKINEGRFLLDTILREHFKYMKDLRLKESTAAAGREVQFTLTSSGTKVKDRYSWKHEPQLFFGLVPLSWVHPSLTATVYIIEDYLVNAVGGWFIILLGVLVTSFFIPNMMQKGTVDLLLSKPIGRVTLLLFKYIGGLTFVFLNSVLAIGGVWLVLGLRSGIWTWSFPLSALIITFFFAVLYAVSTLFAVLTRNSIATLAMTLLVWIILFAIAQANAMINQAAETSRTLQKGLRGNAATTEVDEDAPLFADPVMERLAQTVKVLHAILPRTNELGQLNSQLIRQELLTEEERKAGNLKEEKAVNWGESLGVSLAFIAVMLGLACWRFRVRDY